MKNIGKALLFSFIVLNFAIVAIAQETAQNQPQGSEDRVGESRLSVTQPNGEILEFYRSAVSRWSFYYLPQARFVPLAFDEEDKPLIATHSQSAETYTINVRLRLRPVDMDTEFVENELISRMQSITDSDATPPAGRVSIGLLNLSSIRLELQNPEQADYYGVLAAAEDSISYVNDVPFSLSVDPARGDELLAKINNGLITFRLVTAWNGMTLDSQRVSLHISDIEDTEAFQDLKAGGADLYTVDQMGDIAARIKREITFTQIDSLGGDVEEASISIDDLLNVFDPLDLANLSNERLAELEARWVERFDIGDDVDLADYQPFRVSKEVYETVKDTQDVNQIREDYLEMYDREYEKFTASAGVKWGPFRGGGTYTKEVEEMRNSTDYDFDQMKNFLEQYHEIKYDTEERLFRGLEIFDRTQMNLDSSARITSVSVKPRGGTSSQSIQLTSRDTDHSEMPPSRVEQLIQQNIELQRALSKLEISTQQLSDKNDILSEQLSQNINNLQNIVNSATRFVISDSSSCPAGWTHLTHIGILAHTSTYEHAVSTILMANGGLHNDEWRWAHPRLCIKNP